MHPDPVATRPRPGLREALPAALLIVVAAAFAVAVNRQHLSTWIGPGFSMFSDVDYHGTRHVQVAVTTGEGTAFGVLPEDYTEWAKRQRIQPDRTELQNAAEQFLAMTWTLNEDDRYEAVSEGAPGKTADRVVLRLVTVSVSGDQIVTRPILEEATP